MRIPKSLLFLFLNSLCAYGQEMDSTYQHVVAEFINCLKLKNKQKLASKIDFPLSRQYPITPIENEQEFIKRYNEVFDDSLTKIIVNSQPSKDWSQLGWRGIMLLSGLVWLDMEGQLIAVNYQPEIEVKKWKGLVRMDKSNLYKSLREFERPVCMMETRKYRIRIDDLGGGYGYRYSSWPLKSKTSNKPELIIEKGIYIPEDNGGNGRYEFKNGQYIYDCSMIVVGEENSPPAILTIYKDGRIILSENATNLKD